MERSGVAYRSSLCSLVQELKKSRGSSGDGRVQALYATYKRLNASKQTRRGEREIANNLHKHRKRFQRDNQPFNFLGQTLAANLIALHAARSLVAKSAL
ncbi:hypothetical protein Zmor_008822 [Zophobas morio]|uniref:Uncharacterized protein n=1 Tax=Zophobas morio TaxID=2755281 RepID=A0AA38HH86_9CUCU|nr:hypothetical protein Zmor_008822 [Zophobas morio]